MDEEKKQRLQELARKQAEEQGIQEEDNTENDSYINDSYSYQDDYSDYYESPEETESQQSNNETVVNVDINMGGSVTCPKCGSNRILFQRESSGNLGISQNTVREAPEKHKHGVLYYACGGPFWKILFYPVIWLWRLMTGRTKQKKWNFSGNKNLNHTVAICQNCGYSWKYKAKK